jgi:organic hydroperoxide reductase OsmC/OhrA
VAKTAKEFAYEIAQDRAGRVTAGGRAPLDLEEAWTPEHLVLAGLVRCTLQSLRFHADRAEIDFLAEASAFGRVTRRDSDGRYAFVELEVSVDLELEPEPEPADLGDLLAKAERDCFVGASLTPKPLYRWRVNGRATVPA